MFQSVSPSISRSKRYQTKTEQKQPGPVVAGCILWPQLTARTLCVGVTQSLHTAERHAQRDGTGSGFSLCISIPHVVWSPNFRLIDDRLIAYIALFPALLSRLTALACGSTWVTIAFQRAFFLNIRRSGVLTALTWLVPHETALAVSTQVLCTPYNHAPCHFMQSHIRKCMRV